MGTGTSTAATVSGPRRSGLARVLLVLLALTVLAYTGAALWLMSQETRLVFRAGRPLGSARPSPPFEQVEITRSDGLHQFAWLMPASESGDQSIWVLFLHGNASTIASNANIAHYEGLRTLGLHVMAAEYRGFGGLDGVPTEGSLYTDARAAYDHLKERVGVAPERIVIYGWSLGAAVAVDLASQVPHAALILEGAPASLVAIGQAQYPLFPIRLLMRNPFHAIRKVHLIKSPMLFLHSPEDTVVPIGEGRQLFEAATASKRFVELRGGHVNAVQRDAEAFLTSIRMLLTDAAVLPRMRPVELAR